MAHGLLKQLLGLFVEVAAVVEVGQRIADAHFLQLVGLLQDCFIGLLQRLVALGQFFAHGIEGGGQRRNLAAAMHWHLLAQGAHTHGLDSGDQLAQRRTQAIAQQQA